MAAERLARGRGRGGRAGRGAALRGASAGAALDVYAAQPLAEDHPLRALPNALLTPHAAGLTARAWREMSTVSAEETVRILRGERPLQLHQPRSLAGGAERRRALGHACGRSGAMRITDVQATWVPRADSPENGSTPAISAGSPASIPSSCGSRPTTASPAGARRRPASAAPRPAPASPPSSTWTTRRCWSARTRATSPACGT